MFPPIPPPPASFLAMGFNCTVTRVLIDRNASGGTSTAHAGRPKDYQTDDTAPVPLRCYAEPYVDRSRTADSKPGTAVTWFFMIQDGYAKALDRNYQLVVTQDGEANPHTVNLTGRSRDESGQGLYWVVEGVEYEQ